MKILRMLIGVFLVAVLLIPPISAVGGEYPLDGDMNFFFWNDSSSFGTTYNRLSTRPQPQDTVALSATVSSASGEKTIGSFITEPLPAGTVMGPGLTRYRTYLNVSSAVGITTFDFIPYNVSPSGIETRLFYGVPRTEDVNELVVREYLTSYARRNYTYFNPGDRLLIRVNVSTTSVVERTAYFHIAGTSLASMVQVGYWFGGAGSSGSTFPPGETVVLNQTLIQDPTRGDSVPWILWILSGIIALILIVVALVRSKSQRMDYEINIILSVLAWPFCWYFTWGGLTSIDYIVGAGTTATTNATVMITQHILYNFWVLGYIGVAGSIFAVFVTTLLVSQYNLFKDNEAEATSQRQQKERMNDET